MTATTDLVRPFLPQEFLPEISRGFYNENILFNVFGQPENWASKGSVRITVDVGATTNNGAEIAEDGVLPNSNTTTMAEGTQALATQVVVGKLTDQAAQRGLGAMPKDVSDRSEELINVVQAALTSQFETSLGTAAYLGLTRATYASVLSRAGAATDSGTIATSHLDAAIEALMTPTVGGREAVPFGDIIIMAASAKYFDIAALCKDSTSLIGQSAMQGLNTMGLDKGVARYYNDVPVLHNPYMSTGYVAVGSRSSIASYESAPVQVKELGRTNLVDKYTIHWDGCLVNKKPSGWYLITTS